MGYLGEGELKAIWVEEYTIYSSILYLIFNLNNQMVYAIKVIFHPLLHLHLHPPLPLPLSLSLALICSLILHFLHQLVSPLYHHHLHFRRHLNLHHHLHHYLLVPYLQLGQVFKVLLH